MEAIHYIQTGGTIDKRYPRRPGAYAFEIEAPALPIILTQAKVDTRAFQVSTFCRKDSQEITLADREDLASFIAALDAPRILISHGTDTLLETAQFLFTRNLPKAIVLFGAFVPFVEKESDAAFQTGFALAALKHCPQGVFVAMHGDLLPAQEAVRDLKTGKFLKLTSI